VSTFYRVLRGAGEVRERRRQATHPAKVKPEMQADGPNQVWSWDIQAPRPGDMDVLLPISYVESGGRRQVS
jgi:putative transposase